MPNNNLILVSDEPIQGGLSLWAREPPGAECARGGLWQYPYTSDPIRVSQVCYLAFNMSETWGRTRDPAVPGSRAQPFWIRPLVHARGITHKAVKITM